MQRSRQADLAPAVDRAGVIRRRHPADPAHPAAKHGPRAFAMMPDRPSREVLRLVDPIGGRIQFEQRREVIRGCLYPPHSLAAGVKLSFRLPSGRKGRDLRRLGRPRPPPCVVQRSLSAGRSWEISFMRVSQTFPSAQGPGHRSGRPSRPTSRFDRPSDQQPSSDASDAS
jgi:hypothetical protein